MNSHASEDQNFRVFRNDLSVTQVKKKWCIQQWSGGLAVKCSLLLQ